LRLKPIKNPGLILENLASNCFIDEDLARKIYLKTSQIKNYARLNILVALAANPKTPVDILNQLAKQKDLAILRALASNPGLPFALLAKLAPYPDCKIRKKSFAIQIRALKLLHECKKTRSECGP